MNVVSLTQDLVRCASITPKDEGCHDILTQVLEGMNFTVHRLPYGDVSNIFARIGDKGPHLCYSGHTDVVPTGPEDGWSFGPFEGAIDNGVLYGRGTSDMKGSVAAFVDAVSRYVEKHGMPDGSISLKITGDEEAGGFDGTAKVLEWMDENNQIPDVCLVGEPSNDLILGEAMKIGRRGVLSGWIDVTGKQGHVAYPHKADNPVPKMVKMLAALDAHVFDTGTEYFEPTNLEIVSVDVGNTVTNNIPETITAAFNIRFNDAWTFATLEEEVKNVLKSVYPKFGFKTSRLANLYLTEPNEWTELVCDAVKDITNCVPEYRTTGGSSDARYIKPYCPVVEFGGVNASIHQINENATLDDLENLTLIFVRVLERYFGS